MPDDEAALERAFLVFEASDAWSGTPDDDGWDDPRHSFAAGYAAGRAGMEVTLEEVRGTLAEAMRAELQRRIREAEQRLIRAQTAFDSIDRVCKRLATTIEVLDELDEAAPGA